ncbi:hypothetical protein RND71_008476 [Anisodus tanguticus]|uniref:Uncharacterized protein n=1 Tax=Anisodus tanguticus TaxID=243964 RepID=A0AAE1SNG8_9SOLA|nr:hypothetical protein RND71_008476 [Anisodus tanguticus]
MNARHFMLLDKKQLRHCLHGMFFLQTDWQDKVSAEVLDLLDRQHPDSEDISKLQISENKSKIGRKKVCSSLFSDLRFGYVRVGSTRTWVETLSNNFTFKNHGGARTKEAPQVWSHLRTWCHAYRVGLLSGPHMCEGLIAYPTLFNEEIVKTHWYCYDIQTFNFLETHIDFVNNDSVSLIGAAELTLSMKEFRVNYVFKNCIVFTLGYAAEFENFVFQTQQATNYIGSLSSPTILLFLLNIVLYGLDACLKSDHMNSLCFFLGLESSLLSLNLPEFEAEESLISFPLPLSLRISPI